MWGHDVLFYFPQAFLSFLFLIPIVIGFIYLGFYRQKQIHFYSKQPHSLNLLVNRSFKYTLTKMIGLSFVWMLASLALMGPYGNIRYPSDPQSSSHLNSLQYHPHEVIFLVDTSASMGTLDGFENSSRLDSSKQIIDEILGKLKGQSVSLYSFTSELTPIVPATQDYLFTRLAARSLILNAGDVVGTNYEHVFQSLTKKIFNTPSIKTFTLIFFSDGGDNQVESAKGNEKKIAEQKIFDALPNPEQYFLQSFIIGVGGDQLMQIPNVEFEQKPVYSKLMQDLLKQIANQLKGTYEKANQWSAWSLANNLIEKIGEDPLIQTDQLIKANDQMVTQDQSQIQSDLYFQIPLGVAILFYMLIFLMPHVEKKE